MVDLSMRGASKVPESSLPTCLSLLRKLQQSILPQVLWYVQEVFALMVIQFHDCEDHFGHYLLVSYQRAEAVHQLGPNRCRLLLLLLLLLHCGVCSTRKPMQTVKTRRLRCLR